MYYSDCKAGFLAAITPLHDSLEMLICNINVYFLQKKFTSSLCLTI